MATYAPWEPPVAGTEAQALVGALDRQRATFRWKAGGLDAAGLRARIPSSSLTLGGLLKHLAAVEDHFWTVRLDGAPMGGPWAELGHDMSNDWEFSTAERDSPETLYALYDAAVDRARAGVAAALADGGPDRQAWWRAPDGSHLTVRRLLLDLIEEYGRHTGHADLIREAVDGRVGEDPPPDWDPATEEDR